jgi:hypothetical protein
MMPLSNMHSVDLPDPDGPTNNVKDPRRTVRFTSDSAGVGFP